MAGKVKEKWGKLTDNDLTVIAGKRDQLAGRLRQRYGDAKERLEKGTRRIRAPGSRDIDLNDDTLTASELSQRCALRFVVVVTVEA
jgi:uncharacterized protein YjbJ (UPF0337 family)